MTVEDAIRRATLELTDLEAAHLSYRAAELESEVDVVNRQFSKGILTFDEKHEEVRCLTEKIQRICHALGEVGFG